MKAAKVHFDLRNRHYVEWSEFLASADSWDVDRIRRHQIERLSETVRRAHETTDGYRELYGSTPPRIDSFADARELPFTTKEMIRDRLEAFTSSRARSKYVTTGGSTGIPFGFFRDHLAFARELASKAHLYRRIGWREGDPQLVLRGLVVSSRTHMQFFPRFNELRCSSYHLQPEQMQAYRRAAWKYQPKWLRCYPSSGYVFARHLLESGSDFPQLSGVLCASENLYDFQREAMTRAFGCPIFSHYGHYELAVLAGYCEAQSTYHVLPQYGWAELVDPGGDPVTTPGQVGEIVATSFIMNATPFVRYRTGDLAVYGGEQCPSCGRPHQIWRRIEGRLQEFVVTGRGRLVSMTAINMHDDIFDSIAQFQFAQSRKGRVSFRYVPRTTISRSAVDEIQRRLLVKFGDDVELEMQAVSEIPPTKRGKHRFLIQELPIGFHDD